MPSALSHLIWTAFDYFKIPDAITDLVKAYFQDIQGIHHDTATPGDRNYGRMYHLFISFPHGSGTHLLQENMSSQPSSIGTYWVCSKWQMCFWPTREQAIMAQSYSS